MYIYLYIYIYTYTYIYIYIYKYISAVVLWDRQDYIKEVEKQLGDSDVYEEVPEPLISTIRRTIEEIRKRGDFKK